jgi:hypothetical protein
MAAERMELNTRLGQCCGHQYPGPCTSTGTSAAGIGAWEGRKGGLGESLEPDRSFLGADGAEFSPVRFRIGLLAASRGVGL